MGRGEKAYAAWLVLIVSTVKKVVTIGIYFVTDCIQLT